jgi:hypothetical protein
MKKIIIITTFIIATITHASNREVCTFISPHSPSINVARHMLGTQEIINDEIYNQENRRLFSITPELTLSFRPERIAECLFGQAIVPCSNVFYIQGSQVADRDNHAWLADYFGLPTDFQSRIKVDPMVSNAVIDLQCYLSFDTYLPGLYMYFYAPLIYTHWDLGFCETLITTGSHAHDPGYFNAIGIPREGLLENFSSFISGKEAPRGNDLIFNKITHAKMDYPSAHLFKLADIQGTLGWNILRNQRYHLGGGVTFLIPTGNRPEGAYLFEPIAGNGHHAQLGGSLSTHITVWQDNGTQEKVGIYFDATITHVFGSQQKRSFDLCHNPNSRYMLAEKITPPITNNLRGFVNGELITPSAQYQKEVIPLANLTTLDINVSNHAQADLAFMILYTHKRNSWALGYGYWGQSSDSISICSPSPFLTESWAVKGDAYTFGFENTVLRTPIALSATQSQATINAGKNFPKKGANTPELIQQGQLNLGIDNPTPAQSNSSDNGTFVSLQSQPASVDTIKTSIQPKILKPSDINSDSARTCGHSNKIFSHFNHHIVTQSSIQSFIGFGTEIEFGQSASTIDIARLKERSCINTALSYWGVWLKGGITF